MVNGMPKYLMWILFVVACVVAYKIPEAAPSVMVAPPLQRLRVLAHR